MSGILLSIADALLSITMPAAASIAAVMATFYALAIGLLAPGPEMVDGLQGQMAMSVIAAGIGAAALAWSASRRITAPLQAEYPAR